MKNCVVTGNFFTISSAVGTLIYTSEYVLGHTGKPLLGRKFDVRTVSSGCISKEKEKEVVIAAIVCEPMVVGIDIAVGIAKECIQDHLWIGFWVKLYIWMGTYINISKSLEKQ
ncbi:hypothetical protein BJV82DRAFT_573423 [Fennellomyces sp. T-0311]|nr:hypothetical protein BJV82DRAFT_573423 [Fennellomyces sp. T-0311]